MHTSNFIIIQRHFPLNWRFIHQSIELQPQQDKLDPERIFVYQLCVPMIPHSIHIHNEVMTISTFSKKTNSWLTQAAVKCRILKWTHHLFNSRWLLMAIHPLFICCQCVVKFSILPLYSDVSMPRHCVRAVFFIVIFSTMLLIFFFFFCTVFT